MAKKKRKIAVLDFETDPFAWGRKPYPCVGEIYDGDTSEVFWGDEIWQDDGLFNREACGDDTAGRVARFLMDRYDLVFAHNGGKFDFFYLLPWIDEMKMIRSRIAKCRIGESLLQDSWLILPLPLSQHDKDTKFDYNILEVEERYKPHNKRKIEEYLHRDCVSLYDWVTKFTDRFGRKLTLATATFEQVKISGYDMSEMLTEELDERFRKFYYGGRTEVFKGGKHAGPIYYYDINSAYPFAMLHLHPRGKKFLTTNKIPKNPYATPYFSTITAISRGCLPFRDEKGSLRFPSDDMEREYSVSGWEIQAGLDTGTLDIVEVKECHVWEEYADFSNHVHKFYKEKSDCKENKDKDGETFAKFMLNSAYGKFGLNPRTFKKTELTPIGDIPDEIHKWKELRDEYLSFIDIFEKGEQDETTYTELKGFEEKLYNAFGNIEQKAEFFENREGAFPLGWQIAADLPSDYTIWERPDPGKFYYNVATAASITGFVRAYIWRAICQADEPLYCDTDSIMCRGFKGEVGKELGQWKLEAELSRLWIGGKKMYAAKMKEPDLTKEGHAKWWKTASKGARLTPAQIKRVALGEVVEYDKIAPTFNLKYFYDVDHMFIKREIKATK